EELILYHGRRGTLSPSESGVRIGPQELIASSRVIAAADWDGDHHIDLAIRVQRLLDTSFGATPTDRWGTLVVFWGQKDGSFTIKDTTRLSCGADGWTGPDQGVSVDANSDSVADLVVWGWEGLGLTNGHIVNVPQ